MSATTTQIQRNARAEVFAGIYDLLAERVYRLAAIVTADTAAACRVTQNVFEDLWNAIDHESLPLHPEAGLAEFTDRRVLHHAGPRRPSRGMADAQMAGLCALTELQRRCIALAYRKLLTTDQIARLLDVERRVVHRALREGLLALAPSPATGRR